MTWRRRGLRIVVTAVCFAAPALIALVLAGGDGRPASVHAATQSLSSRLRDIGSPSAGLAPILRGHSLKSFLDRVNAANVSANDYVLVPVYEVDEDESARPQLAVRTCVMLPRSATAKERFDGYVQRLSRYIYESHPITLMRFDEQGAVVDLPASSDNPSQDYWYQRFQGSAGGGYTETELLLNLAQPGVDLEWPRQVEVLYRGHPCTFDHAATLSAPVPREDMLPRLLTLARTAD